MKWFETVFQLLLSLGIPGVFLLAILDSTIFFFMPFAIDFLYIYLVSHKHEWLPFYMLLTVSGSLIGSAITYSLLARTGEQALEKRFPSHKLKRFKDKLEKRGFWALVFASLLPPPFPFSPFVVAASISKLSFKKLLAGVAVGRALKFLTEGVLAIVLGRKLLNVLDSTAFKAVMFGIFLLAAVGSAVSIYRWFKKPQPATA